MALAFRVGVAPSDGVTEAIVADYGAAVVAAGGSLSEPHRTALLTFVETGRNAGWFAKIIDCCPFLGNSLATSLIKLVAASGAGSSYVNHNFVGGDYSASVGLGVSANATKYLGTGVIPGDHGLDAGSYAVVSGGVNDANFLGQGLFGTNETGVSVISSIGGGPYISWTRAYAAGVTYLGGVHASACWDGIDVQDIDYASSGDLLTEMFLFRIVKFGTEYLTNTGSLGFFAIAEELTRTQLRSFTTAVRQLHLSARGVTVNARLLFIGDSITYGQGVNKPDSWVELVAAGDGSDDVTNLGMSGSTMVGDSGSGLAGEHRITGASSFHVGRAYIMMGSNDIVVNDGTTDGDPAVISTYRTALANTASTLKAQGADVVICSIPYTTRSNATKVAAWVAAAMGAASDAGVTGVNTCQPMIDSGDPGQYLIDDVHPNAAGHAFIASTVLAAL